MIMKKSTVRKIKMSRKYEYSMSEGLKKKLKVQPDWSREGLSSDYDSGMNWLWSVNKKSEIHWALSI